MAAANCASGGNCMTFCTAVRSEIQSVDTTGADTISSFHLSVAAQGFSYSMALPNLKVLPSWVAMPLENMKI